MKILEGLRGWFSQTGAPWRPYPEILPPGDRAPGAGGPFPPASRQADTPRRAPTHRVPANDGAHSSPDWRDIAKSSHALITASRMSGARVICGDDRVDGHLCDLSINKKTGRIDYVLIAFSGFLGFVEKIYPLPWSFLTYDPAREAYRIPFRGAALRAAPPLSANDLEWFGAGDEAWRAARAQSYWPYLTPPI